MASRFRKADALKEVSVCYRTTSWLSVASNQKGIKTARNASRKIPLPGNERQRRHHHSRPERPALNIRKVSSSTRLSVGVLDDVNVSTHPPILLTGSLENVTLQTRRETGQTAVGS
ncbi:hypothetical protein Bbelb_332340 [Branchiostoma belcheri]|nr:hypothetical protein Bbelb_332340 [Branchiostoma belcheri]